MRLTEEEQKREHLHQLVSQRDIKAEHLGKARIDRDTAKTDLEKLLKRNAQARIRNLGRERLPKSLGVNRKQALEKQQMLDELDMVIQELEGEMVTLNTGVRVAELSIRAAGIKADLINFKQALDVVAEAENALAKAREVLQATYSRGRSPLHALSRLCFDIGEIPAEKIGLSAKDLQPFERLNIPDERLWVELENQRRHALCLLNGSGKYSPVQAKPLYPSTLTPGERAAGDLKLQRKLEAEEMVQHKQRTKQTMNL